MRLADGSLGWTHSGAVPILKRGGSSNGRRRDEDERLRLAAAVEQSGDFIGVADPQGNADGAV